jgi:hypothetical protein
MAQIVNTELQKRPGLFVTGANSAMKSKEKSAGGGSDGSRISLYCQ